MNDAWLVGFRRAAQERFAGLGFPTPRTEGWRQTGVASVSRMPLGLSTSPKSSHRLLEEFLGRLLPRKSQPTLVFQAGLFVPELSRSSEGADFLVQPLSEAIQNEEPDVRASLAQANAIQENAFSALNGARFCDGAFVCARSGEQSGAPRKVRIVHFAEAGQGEALYPRTLIVAEPGARLQVLEVFARGQASDPFLNSPVTEIVVGEGAEVEYVRVQADPMMASHIGNLRVKQQARSFFRGFSFSMGAALARIEIGVELLGPGTKSDFDGVTLVQGTQHADHHVRMDHRSSQGASSQLFHSVARDQGRSIFTGRVIVQPRTSGNDARQNSRNILLSDEARAHSEPQLEIRSDDVRCSHGSATGKLDEEALFYLRTRGLDDRTARSLLVEAFAETALSKVGDATVRERITDWVRTWCRGEEERS